MFDGEEKADSRYIVTLTLETIRIHQKSLGPPPWVNLQSNAHHCLVGGFNPSEKYEFVSWDDDIPNIWKVKKLYKIHVPNHQPVIYPHHRDSKICQPTL